MNDLFTKAPESGVIDVLERLTTTLESFLPDDKKQTPPSLADALAYRWQYSRGMFARGALVPVISPQLISFSDLKNIDEQSERLFKNTHQFVNGYPSNNVLMTGARGTGKSSLVRACLEAFHNKGLRLIEVEKEHLNDLPDILNLIRNNKEKYLIFCDDLSFEEGENSYKGLKTVLDGSIVGTLANVLVYATSNRKHMITERMSDNLEHRKGERDEIHPGDAVEEKISLSDRFGLHLNFYSFNQNEYLDAVSHWLNSFSVNLYDDESIRNEAIQWATQRGTRSGRTAWQFARDYAGRKMMDETEV
tara:strand:- start:71284 stop:72198 length:915 start_codon:yes stop_codon:yes gene_type:complete